jgi:hypothetical protein
VAQSPVLFSFFSFRALFLIFLPLFVICGPASALNHYSCLTLVAFPIRPRWPGDGDLKKLKKFLAAGIIFHPRNLFKNHSSCPTLKNF